MNEYIVLHPGSDIVALIHAPTTDKARTTYLDYLERQGLAARNQRHLIRKALVTKKVDSSTEFEHSIELYYDYIPQSEGIIINPESQITNEEAQFGVAPIVEEPVQEVPANLSPIAQMALNSVGGNPNAR